MLQTINQLIFPNRHICYTCNKRDEDVLDYICHDCKSNLDILNREINMNLINMEKIYYSLAYNRFIKEQIKGYKYNGKTYLYKAFGKIMLDTLDKYNLEDEFDIIMYVPMHKRKEAKRGYNQAEFLARHISKALNKPLIHSLIKIKSTKEQNKSHKLDRLSNLEDAFSIKYNKEIIDKRILLIDDIITTGSTLEQCGKVLLENGASKIIGMALTSSKNI